MNAGLANSQTHCARGLPCTFSHGQHSPLNLIHDQPLHDSRNTNHEEAPFMNARVPVGTLYLII